MLVKLDDEIIFEISDTMVKLIGNDILDPIDDIKRRLKYVIEHKCDRCYDRLLNEWMPKIENDEKILSVPKMKKDICKMIFSMPGYMSRAEREKAEIEKKSAEA